MRMKTVRNWYSGVSCGDGWNAYGYGHTQRRTKGRKKIRRAARHELKRELRTLVEEG